MLREEWPEFEMDYEMSRIAFYERAAKFFDRVSAEVRTTSDYVLGVFSIIVHPSSVLGLNEHDFIQCGGRTW